MVIGFFLGFLGSRFSCTLAPSRHWCFPSGGPCTVLDSRLAMNLRLIFRSEAVVFSVDVCVEQNKKTAKVNMNNVFFFNWQEQQTQDRKLDKVMISSIMSSRTPRWDLWQWSLWSRISQSWTEGFTGNAIPVENPYQLMDWCRNDERIEPEIFGFSPFFFGVAVVFAQCIGLGSMQLYMSFCSSKDAPLRYGKLHQFWPLKSDRLVGPFPKNLILLLVVGYNDGVSSVYSLIHSFISGTTCP